MMLCDFSNCGGTNDSQNCPNKTKNIEFRSQSPNKFLSCGETNHDTQNCPNKTKNIEFPSQSPNKF